MHGVLIIDSYSLYEFEVYNTANTVIPIVPPDPDGKDPDQNLDPLIPLPPNDPGKETILVGEADTGQENEPTPGTAPGDPSTAINTGLPTAHILYPLVDVVAGGSEVIVLFQGVASDNDEDGQSIVAYEWRSDRDGLLSNQATFTRALSSLTLGRHVITFRAQDNEGNWSEWAQIVVQINAPNLNLPVITK
ncbi:MAG: hypothetical protein HZC40_18180 [Chloroflexi bacterium]|nr:hypothetical protein [Chloroflexota bacterium]